MSRLRIHYQIYSHPNQPSRRAINEDAVLAVNKVLQGRIDEGGDMPVGQPGLFTISDALHATPSAAYASRTLLKQLDAIWQENTDVAPGRKIRQLHERFCDAATGYPEREGMACILVAVEIRECHARIYHVSDSRAWHIRGGRASCLTHDHTALETMIRAGEVEAAEAEDYASVYGQLANYFMASPFEPSPAHDTSALTLDAGDQLLLASDGVSVLDSDAISQNVDNDARATLTALFDASMAAGSDDNISMILVRLSGKVMTRRLNQQPPTLSPSTFYSRALNGSPEKSRSVQRAL